jgi:hypothetical protein
MDKAGAKLLDWERDKEQLYEIIMGQCTGTDYLKQRLSRLTTDFGTYNFTSTSKLEPTHSSLPPPSTRPHLLKSITQLPLHRGQPKITHFFSSTSKHIGGDHPT